MNATMSLAANNAEGFLTILRKSQLIDATKLDEALSSLDDPVNSEAKDVAQAFINMGLLTRFQVRLLLQGKWRGFFIAGKYRLLDMIGEGGMGKVYLCEHQRMQRLVAIKVLPLRLAEDSAARERFDREARAIAALNHPNIVTAYDIDSHEGMHYLVMEFVDGVSLQALVALRGPITVSRAVNYIGQAAAGLQHGHEMGLVHRDIKPANLLLGRDGIVKVLDYGLARFFDNRGDDFTRRHEGNSIIGTADYLAPEQAIDCSDVDVRADLYALGGTVYYLLTGQPPFGKDIPTHVKLLSHQAKEPQPLRELRPDVDPVLCAIITKLMMKKPELRFQEPKEVLEALQPWLNQPVPPPTDDEIPMRDALTTRAATGNSTAKIGSGSSVATKNRGKSVTIVVDKSKEVLPPPKKQLPPWIWAGAGGIIVGLLFLLWPRSNPNPAPPTERKAVQSTPASGADFTPVIISKGSSTGLRDSIPSRLEVETEATLSPKGVLTIERGLSLAAGSTLAMEPGAQIKVKQGSINVNGAMLMFSLPGDVSPGSTVCLIQNETGQPLSGGFVGSPHGQMIRSRDGKWEARISYQGNAARKTSTGGNDVVLHEIKRTN